MGHLINPVALRMGWTSNWVDSFFADFKYYPLYLHMIFRLRLLLSKLFSDKWFEQAGFFYSHFLLLKSYNGLKVEIYFYDGVCESFVYFVKDLVDDSQNELKQRLISENYSEKKSGEFWTFYTFFIIFYLLNKFRIFNLSPVFKKHAAAEALATSFFSFSKIPFLGITKPFTYNAAFSKNRLRLFFFYLLCRAFIHREMEESENGGNLPREEMLHHLFVVVFALLRNKFLFHYVSSGLYYILSMLTSTFDRRFLDHCVISFLIISNDHVTAKFISRYIARKLAQEFTIQSLMSPLKQEFQYLCSLSSHSGRKAKILFENFTKRAATVTYFSMLFRGLMHRLAIIHGAETDIFCNQVKNKLSYDSFLFLSFLYKSLLPTKRLLFAAKFEISYKPLLAFAKKYMEGYFYFILFNYYNMFDLYNILLEKIFFSLKPPVFFNTYKLNLFFLPKLAASMNYTSFEDNLNWNSLLPYYYKRALLSSFFLLYKTKLLLTYNKYHGSFLKHAIISNNRWQRLMQDPMDNRTLKGFKVQLLGRFTRRQRAAKLTWMYGKVPLNTLSSHIEYADYSVVLRNSLINVKVWFNKSPHFKTFYFRLI